MIRGQSLKQLYESLGPGPFVREVYHYLGLSSREGKRHRTHAGNPRLVDPADSAGKPLSRFHPTEFSFKDLAESLIGSDWAQQMRPDVMQRVALQEERSPLLEAGTAAIQASAFANINAFTAVVSGLLEVSVMQAWENPEFIADQLAPAEPTKMFDGRKVIGTTRLGDVAEVRYPGMPTKRASFGERWILQPRTVENALACEVTQEAVYLDLTGEVLDQANSVGDWLAWRKEIRVIDAFIGVTNTYSYSGTNYNTYLINSTWNNDQSNELLHWTNIQNAEILFRDMLDPATNTRVRITADKVLVNQEKLYVAQQVLGVGTEVEYRDIPGSTTNPQYIRRSPNPVAGKYQVLTSPLVYQRCTDADGLNLSSTNAGKYWWIWDSKRPPLKYAQNWPLRVQQAAPNQLDMIDRGVVLYVKADERGIPMWYEPRRIVRNKN